MCEKTIRAAKRGERFYNADYAKKCSVSDAEIYVKRRILARIAAQDHPQLHSWEIDTLAAVAAYALAKLAAEENTSPRILLPELPPGADGWLINGKFYPPSEQQP